MFVYLDEFQLSLEPKNTSKTVIAMLIVNAFSNLSYRLIMAVEFVLKHAIPSPVILSKIFVNLEVMAYLVTVQTVDFV